MKAERERGGGENRFESTTLKESVAISETIFKMFGLILSTS